MTQTIKNGYVTLNIESYAGYINAFRWWQIQRDEMNPRFNTLATWSEVNQYNLNEDELQYIWDNLHLAKIIPVFK